MKFRITHIALALGAMLTLSGCEVVTKVIRTGEQAISSFARTPKAEATPQTHQAAVELTTVPEPSEFTEIEPAAKPAASSKPAAKPSGTKTKPATRPRPTTKAEIKPEAKPAVTPKPAKKAEPAPSPVKPEPVQQPEPEVPAAPQPDHELMRTLDGEWQIVAVGEKKIQLEDDMPYIIFESKTGRFYANNGCNVLNGMFSTTEGARLHIHNVLTSLKYCPDDGFSYGISSLLNDNVTMTARIKSRGHDTYIYLENEATKSSMTLRCHNMNFLNGNWRVASINGNAIDDEEANIFIDIPALKIHGNTGCNYFNGEIYLDPTRSNAIDFSQMSVTLMSCPKTSQETAMLVALEQTASAIPNSDGSATLLDNSGNNLLVLKRIK